MQFVGNAPAHTLAENSAQLGGRVLSVCAESGRLRLTEIGLDEFLRVRSVLTDAPAPPGCRATACAFNGAILCVLADRDEPFAVRAAALVSPGPWPLFRESVRVQCLALPRERVCLGPGARLARKSETEAFVCSPHDRGLQVLRIAGGAVAVEPLPAPSPLRLLTAGRGCALFAALARQLEVFRACGPCGEFSSLGELGELGELCARDAEYAQVGAFLIGFGGGGGGDSDSDGLVVHDTATGRSALVHQSGDWHAPDGGCVLAATESHLFILGGRANAQGAKIALGELCGRIRDDEVRCAFHLEVTGRPLTVADWARGRRLQGRAPQVAY